MLGKNTPFYSKCSSFVLILFGSWGCASLPELSEIPFLKEPPLGVGYEVLARTPIRPISYEHEVKPILNKRCVVCHGCYDSPCQLKLSSYEGITRGLSREPVYDGARFLSQAPSRLFIDGKSREEWRKKGFSPVVNEGPERSPEENLEKSLLYHALRLKQLHPQPREGKLSEDLEFGVGQTLVCAPLESYGNFAQENPLAGMPYGLPNLSDKEYQTLVSWVAQGAPGPKKDSKPDYQYKVIRTWERFFNRNTSKGHLVSRYIYEHLFLASLSIKGTKPYTYYRFIRSRTPMGQEVDEIATVRPYDQISGKFYYRLRLMKNVPVAKNHIVYELSKARLKRYEALFYKPKYKVSELPSYAPTVVSNPFKAFKELPVLSRYKFLLDDSHFFIQGFIKGPVCRGQIALDVIEDHFWVFFVSPKYDLASNYPQFLPEMGEHLSMPVFKGDEMPLIGFWTDYWDGQKEYMKARARFVNSVRPAGQRALLKHIWNGEKTNKNASLTVFRHFDSASVRQGLAGDYPETAWVIDYPLFERIHYLLVAGFNVFGNVGHQLNTRVYMDFLRMDGENQFLAFLPKENRASIREYWYQGLRESIFENFKEIQNWSDAPSDVSYKTSTPQKELYNRLEKKLGAIYGDQSDLHRCSIGACLSRRVGRAERLIDEVMKTVASNHGEKLKILPDVAFLRVRRAGRPDLAYTLIHNKAYKNVTFFSGGGRTDRGHLDVEKDTMTVVKGLEGSYPNFFYVVDGQSLQDFSTDFARIRSEKDYEQFIGRYGVRRTSSQFWAHSDWFYDFYRADKLNQSGLFDLNRYENR